MMMLTTLTKFGDLAVLVPLSIVLFTWLMVQARNTAWWWALAFALCTSTTALLKIYLGACPLISDLHSPSGHTSLSTLVFGAFITVMIAGRPRYQQIALVFCGAALAAGVALSRVALNAHSPIDVVLGAAIGTMALAVFVRGYLQAGPAKGKTRPLLVAATVLIVFLHGQELRAEEFLHAVRDYLVAGGTLSCG